MTHTPISRTHGNVKARTDEQYFYSFSQAGYAPGINVLLYTMTH
jgi:hypothetical protein